MLPVPVRHLFDSPSPVLLEFLGNFPRYGASPVLSEYLGKLVERLDKPVR